MAAYASLVSLEHIINNLENHSRPPISLHKQQVHLLTQKITFLQRFLQLYNPSLPYSKEADPLETRIARAAYAAEDAIESHILAQFTDNDGEKMSFDSLYEALEKVIEDMALIKKEAMEIEEIVGFRNQLRAKSTPPDSSGSFSSMIVMAGADDLLLEMKDKLTSDARDLQTIPIVGMGGSGKTTLALSVYQDGLIKEHFHTCVWVTISQEYSIQHILIQLLTQLVGKPSQGLSEGELGEMLHKHLYSKRFIVILDDVWSVKAWDGVKRFLPNNKNGSRVVITTRLTTLASTLSDSYSLRMKLLDEDDSWDLLSKIVYGGKGCCPYGFEEIGKRIGKSCKGLPLSIVVVGGLLAKSEKLIEFWEHVEENLNAIVNLDDDERCLKTLFISYQQLPVHLKPCFLYMGIYREDHVIGISELIKLWVAEGFLKPISGERLEDVASAYLEDLIDRNLILIHKLGKMGNVKECKVHDLLRDLCLREAQKGGFYTIHAGHEMGNEVSRIVNSGSTPSSSSPPLARSLILNLRDHEVLPHALRRLRIVSSGVASDEFLDSSHQLVNSRFFSTACRKSFSSMWTFWNLHTLAARLLPDHKGFIVATDIWYMSHIRHLRFNKSYLPDPTNLEDGIVLANLQTLETIRDFTCSEQVVKRIPNLRKLKICYYDGVDGRFRLTNLDRLEKLESFDCVFYEPMCLVNYPQSLKKLTLQVHESQHWEDMLDKIGDLPLLQKLKILGGTFKGEWETSEGQFRSLRFLSLLSCEGLRVWTSEASHFPRLEHLHLWEILLEEIPLDFAEISTLRVIDMGHCHDSAIVSAKRIVEEQETLYGEEEVTLQIEVRLLGINDPELESLRGPNFHVRSHIPLRRSNAMRPESHMT